MEQKARRDYYLTKRGAVWYVRFRDAVTGKVTSWKSTGCTNQTRADKWARDRYADLKGSVGKSGDTFRTWSAPFFLEKCPHKARLKDEGKQYSDKTASDARRYLDNDLLSDPIADMPLSEIRRAHVLALRERLVAKRGRSRSAGIALQTFRVVVREAMERGIIETDPVSRIGNPSYKKRERKAVGMLGILALLCGEWEHDETLLAVLTASMTGMRAGELRGLRWQDVHKDEGFIHVCNQIHDTEGAKLPKWGKIRDCPYPLSLQRVLEPRRMEHGEYVFSIVRGAPLSYRTLFDDMRRAADIESLRGLTPHGLRHSLNSLLVWSGSSTETIRATFGWSDPSVQRGYTHDDLLPMQAQSKAIESLFGG